MKFLIFDEPYASRLKINVITIIDTGVDFSMWSNNSVLYSSSTEYKKTDKLINVNVAQNVKIVQAVHEFNFVTLGGAIFAVSLKQQTSLLKGTSIFDHFCLYVALAAA